MSEEQAVYHARTEPDINLVPKTKVDVALIYARYCESKGKDDGGYPELFTRKFPAKSPAAKVLEMQDWEPCPTNACRCWPRKCGNNASRLKTS